RIATSKAPQINRDELKKLLQSEHPGQPGANVQASPAQGQAPQVAQNSPPAPQPSQPQGLAQQQPSDQTARLQAPPSPAPSFKTPMTARSAIEQAAEAAAASRGHYGAGQAGDGGLTRGRNQPGAALPGAEILTDTLGVDFGPYLTRILQVIKQNW